MELKNSLLHKIQNENVLHSSTKEEFIQVESIITKLRKDNQYWSLFNQIRQLIKNDNYDDLQKASELLAEREFNYVNSFRDSTQTILEPYNNNSYQSEKTTFLNYLKKQLYFQDNFEKVKKHYDLYYKVNSLSNSITSFKNRENHTDTPTFNSLGFAIGYPVISFVVYIGFLFISGNNVNSILNMIFALIFLGGVIYGIYSLYHIFFTKDGWRSISDYTKYKKDKKEYENLKMKLNRLKNEINTVANNGYK